MAKEWILNIATNRWGLNKKNNVGPVALWIRECHPKSISDWENYYFQKLRDFLEEKGMRFAPDEYIKHLGQKLYIKISETLSAEINEVTEADCVDYIRNLLINRTYEGYQNEVKTIYGYLENVLGVKIHPAPDKWDRLYKGDFYIKTSDKVIGLQIKPLTYLGWFHFTINEFLPHLHIFFTTLLTSEPHQH